MKPSSARANPGFMTAQSNAINTRSIRLLVAVTGVFLLLALALYWQSLAFDYVYFDDTSYVLNNPHVSAGFSFDSIYWAFTSNYMGNWHPLTWLSHMLDVSLFGTDPGWAHFHNAILHALSSVLVYSLMSRLLASNYQAFVLAVIFLVHPIHVESVAWIAERKDLLCAIFFLSTLILYDRYQARPTPAQYSCLLLVFALALLSKPMAVTLPALLVMLDCFHYRRPGIDWEFSPGAFFRTLTRSTLHKLPLFVLSVAFSLIAIFSQRDSGALMNVDFVPVSLRIENAAYSYLVYLRQFFIPVELGPYYLLKQVNAYTYLLLPAILFLAWLLASFRLLRTKPIIMVGLCWYLLTLLPVIGLIQVGTQIHADRYMYIPSIGVLLAAALCLPGSGHKYHAITRTLAGIFVLYLSVLCYWQVGYWENKKVLFNRALRLTSPIWKAHIELAQQVGDDVPIQRPATFRVLGDLSMAVGDTSEALAFYSHAVMAPSPSAQLLNNYALALLSEGYTEKARQTLERALQLAPHSTEYRNNYQQLFNPAEQPAP
jgi:tetratricopeptide (TPR) repeat protein